MNTEQKARAYDEVREKIALRFGSNVAEEIFSEIEMSEDERIRKELINYLKYRYNSTALSGEERECKKWIAWLESQGEQKSIKNTWAPSEEQMKVLDEVLTYAAQHENPYWNDYIFGTLCDLIRQLKKIKEE